MQKYTKCNRGGDQQRAAVPRLATRDCRTQGWSDVVGEPQRKDEWQDTPTPGRQSYEVRLDRP